MRRSPKEELIANRRDVTDHLQLLLRKSGYHLHTTAEKEVVRMISEQSEDERDRERDVS